MLGSVTKSITALAIMQLVEKGSVDLDAKTPGSFEYSNANYVVLGRIVEVVSGTSYASYIDDNVFRPPRT